MKQAVGHEATAVRSQTYYLDITPPGHDKGTFVDAMAKRLGIPADAVATIGDMENDLPMFAKSGVSFAMGNAADDIKQHATHVTDSNEHDGFAARDRDGAAARIEPIPSPGQAFARKRHAPPYQACVKDKSRSSQSLRAANPLLSAGTIGKREPVSDRRLLP